MKRAWYVIACAVLVGSASISCGPSTGSSVGPSSGLPRGSTVGSLTTAQAVVLCDWTNARQGGYGRNVTCTDGSTQTTDPNQADCVAGVPFFLSYCPTLTVGDAEDCTNAVLIDLCSLPNQAACANVNACLNSAPAPAQGG
jgi:hypothetical protein